jgi:(S)-sulfolactate dehydrogenase
VARIVIAEFMDPASVELLTGRHDVTHDPSLGEERNRLLQIVSGADALVVRNRTRVDAELLAAAPRLAVVGRLGVGLDNIDTDACVSRGVAVRTAVGANAVAVAEHVIGALLSLARPALRATERLVGGEWPRTDLVGVELAGRVLGLVGLGATARQVAQRGAALGMPVIAHDPFVVDPPPGVEMADVDGVFARAGAVSLHVPLAPETVGLVGEARLQMMPEGALLVDTSRGGVVDHHAVVDALRQRRLGGAALDVFSEEPPVDVSLYRGVPNLILTPHVAGVTVESNRRVGRMVAEAVLEVLEPR